MMQQVTERCICEMKRMICFLLTLCLLAGCGLAGAESSHLQGKPWVNSNIYGQWPDERPGPEDGYDMYVNYAFYREALARGDASLYVRLLDAEKTVQKQFTAMCEDPGITLPEAEILRILYSLYMDTAKRKQEGLAPLKAYVDRVRAVKTLDELTSLIREDGWIYGPSFFTYALDVSDGANRKYILQISRDEIEGVKEKLLLMGYSEEEAAKADEKLLAFKAAHNVVINIEPGSLLDNISNRGTASLDELRQLCPLFPDLLSAQGVVRKGTEAEQIYKILNHSELIWFRDLYREENLEILKALITAGMYKGMEAILPKAGEDSESADLTADFNNFVPEAVTHQAYLRRYVPQERIDQYYSLVDEYKEALRARFEQSSWLSEGTKKEAVRKLDNLIASKLEYPYGDIDCKPLLEKLRSCKTLIEAAGLCAQFDRECMAHFSGRDFVRGNRFRSGHSVLACEGKYSLQENIFFLGGGSLTLMWDATSRETVLGSIGVHLAHELSHAFDTTGAQHNADFTGSLFTEEDQRIFAEKAETIARQVDIIEPLDGLKGNGKVKIGEVLADMTGMSLSLDLAKKEAHFDYDAFFSSFARFFTCYMSEPLTVIPPDVETNPHPLPYIRVNFTVQRFEEFYKAYPSVTEGTPMYLAPEDRLLIW